MRKIPSSVYGSRRRKRRSCGGCLGRLIGTVAVLAILFWIGSYLGLSEKLIETQYPIKYQEWVEKYAEEFSLEKELVYAIIRSESKFDPYAVSNTGAKGLMQIQEETAKDCIRELKLSNIKIQDLLEPEFNIHLGCYYFSKLLKRYHGNQELAIAAYNGGPGNVEKWLKNEAYTNEKGELVHIPFPETRNYVKRVKKACEMYHRLYTDER